MRMIALKTNLGANNEFRCDQGPTTSVAIRAAFVEVSWMIQKLKQ
jgi:hypothetical protein